MEKYSSNIFGYTKWRTFFWVLARYFISFDGTDRYVDAMGVYDRKEYILNIVFIVVYKFNF